MIHKGLIPTMTMRNSHFLPSIASFPAWNLASGVRGPSSPWVGQVSLEIFMVFGICFFFAMVIISMSHITNMVHLSKMDKCFFQQFSWVSVAVGIPQQRAVQPHATHGFPGPGTTHCENQSCWRCFTPSDSWLSMIPCDEPPFHSYQPSSTLVYLYFCKTATIINPIIY